MCVNHGQRPAIGVCVITHRPICAECSTRYEGVNYSKEGLRILHEKRAAESHAASRSDGAVAVLAVLLAPLMLLLVYWFYRVSVTTLIDLQQIDFRGLLNPELS
jgi:hypothetical protein